MFEQAVSPQQIATDFGVTPEYVRGACRRMFQPLPHVRHGRNFRIRRSVFEAWYRAEELRTVGIEVDAGTRGFPD